MTQPKICVLRAPGTNCDIETAHAFEMCGGNAERVHLFRLLEQPEKLNDYQILCIPGGFSYGDDIGAGVIVSRQLQIQLAEAIHNFLQQDKLVLGICNGFQVLLKAGLLPDGAAGWPPTSTEKPPATLTWNRNGKYTALWVRLKVTSSKSIFLRNIDEIDLPIAHAEGRIALSDESLLEKWRANEQIAICYQSVNGQSTGSSEILPYPENPNGSIGNIAGLSDTSGRVLGLMPHPERFLHATQHPQWTRLQLEGTGCGLKLFQNAVDYFGT